MDFESVSFLLLSKPTTLNFQGSTDKKSKILNECSKFCMLISAASPYIEGKMKEDYLSIL